MNRIDETRPFIPVRIAVLTVSDTRTKKTDKSGPLLVSLIKQAGHQLAEHTVVEDDPKAIRKRLKRWIKQTPAVWNAVSKARAFVGSLKGR